MKSCSKRQIQGARERVALRAERLLINKAKLDSMCGLERELFLAFLYRV